jgi:ribosomal protein S18 acetylase RimI-like enzyme
MNPGAVELDNPVWWAVTGSQRALGTVTPLAARFHPEVSPFGALAGEPTEDHWNDLAGLVGPAGTVALFGAAGGVPSGWKVLRELSVVQMVGDRISHVSAGSGATPASGVDPTAARPSTAMPEDTPVPLGEDDVDDMLALVALAEPGPFLRRTVEFGGYVGIRRHGRLVAMAGERLRPPGYTEVSAVATDPDHRRQGLAERLTRVVTAAIDRRGETPILHAEKSNAGAIRLYESMGFTARRRVALVVVRAPGA